MASIYANHVKCFGRRWYRPCLGLLLFVLVPSTFLWFFQATNDEAQIVCTQSEGSRYRAAVEIDDLFWTADLEAALACAAKHDRRVFLAFHAVSDTNARLNERTVFQDRRAKSILKRYVLVKLYEDFVPEEYYRQKPNESDQRKDAEANLKFEEKRFATAQEPLYVVLQPTGKGDFRIVAEYDETRINDPARFIRFLHDPRPAPPDGLWQRTVQKLRHFVERP